tara:strand:+ start:562 stop:720 length:159 start_codon:yes stop_codon:yes gene_type:complete
VNKWKESRFTAPVEGIVFYLFKESFSIAFAVDLEIFIEFFAWLFIVLESANN